MWLEAVERTLHLRLNHRSGDAMHFVVYTSVVVTKCPPVRP